MEDSDADSELRISKKRKSTVIESSSDEDEVDNSCTKTPDQKVSAECPENSSTRSSARIAKRQSRSFEMPSRDSVWEKIKPTKHPDKYHLLTPRKLVNNYTKENSRYNFDPNYTSGEESLDAFIIDSDVSPDTDSSIAETKSTKKRANTRVKNRKERIVIASSSDSESEADDQTTWLPSSKRVDKKLKASSTPKCDNISNTSCEDSQSNESGFEEGINKNNNKSDENEDEEVFMTPCHRKCKSNVIESDSESDSQDAKSETGKITDNQESNETDLSIEAVKPATPAKPPTQSLGCNQTESPSCSRKRSGSNSSSVENKKEMLDVEVEEIEISSDTGDSRSGDKTDSSGASVDDTGSNSGTIDGEDSQSSDSELENVTSRTRVQMVKKKKEKLKLFEKFRQARERKLKKEKKSTSADKGS